jgi:hypothetical protein
VRFIKGSKRLKSVYGSKRGANCSGSLKDVKALIKKASVGQIDSDAVKKAGGLPLPFLHSISNEIPSRKTVV